MSEQRIESARRPLKCPACGAAPVAEIQYGYPVFSPELEQQIQEGKVSLGGCCVTGDDPAWECTRCGQKIHRRMA